MRDGYLEEKLRGLSIVNPEADYLMDILGVDEKLFNDMLNYCLGIEVITVIEQAVGQANTTGLKILATKDLELFNGVALLCISTIMTNALLVHVAPAIMMGVGAYGKTTEVLRSSDFIAQLVHKDRDSEDTVSFCLMSINACRHFLPITEEVFKHEKILDCVI